MEIQDILGALTRLTGHFPREALAAAIAQQEAITPHLIKALEDAPRVLDQLLAEEDYILPFYAFYLLAQFREERAYPLIEAFFSIPGDACFDVTGDFVTESLGKVLASVSGGDTAPMKRMAANPEINTYVRNAALCGMLTLVAEGVTPRDEVITYFWSLFHGGLERTPDFMWSGLVNVSTDLYPGELMPEIRSAFADNLVDALYIDLHEVEQAMVNGEAAAQVRLREKPYYRFVNDAIAEMSWWACFQTAPAQVQQKVGRNAPCPCGSGLKYKHCCGKRRPTGVKVG